MEYRTGNRVADVAIIGTKRKIAVEIQLSPIPCDQIEQRTYDHAVRGFETLWLIKLCVGLDEIEQGSQYKIRAFEIDIHDLSCEALFVHRSGLTFDVVHLMGYSYKTYKHFKVSRYPVHSL